MSLGAGDRDVTRGLVTWISPGVGTTLGGGDAALRGASRTHAKERRPS
jgi:hypothetical protein